MVKKAVDLDIQAEQAITAPADSAVDNSDIALAIDDTRDQPTEAFCPQQEQMFSPAQSRELAMLEEALRTLRMFADVVDAGGAPIIKAQAIRSAINAKLKLLGVDSSVQV